MKQAILSLLLALLPLMTSADAIEFDGIFYNLNSETNGAIVTSANDKYKGDIIIPNEININGQIITVTTIDKDAFVDCVNMTSITIPNSVNSIATGAFRGCNNLASITVANGNKTYDSRYNCNAVIETLSNTLIIGCKNTIIPYGIKTIGFAFQDCKSLTSIDIPNSVTYIIGSFSGCSNLTSVKIPNSVTELGEYSFSGCTSLSSIDIPNSVTFIGSFAFANCQNLSSLTIPNSVTIIGSNAFEQCRGLKTISIPNSVKAIGSWAFAWCQSLTNIVIPNSVSEIKNNLFYRCLNIVSVTIPKSVTKIGTAFDCVKLKDVYCYAEDVPEAEDYSFFISAVDNDPTLHVPSTSIDKYKKANIWREFRHIVALTDEEIEDYNNNNPVIDNIILTGIEGCYQTQPDSHRSYNGNDVTYKGTYEIQIFDNGDGTYYVDDLLGGWYSQRAGYGSNYAMNGDIAITTDGTVSLKDSHVTGWDDGLINLTGTYDANKLSFTIEAEYVSGMKFFQTWVKSGQIFNSNGINYRIEENHNVSVVDTKKNYSGDVVIPNEVTYNGIKYSVTSIGGAFHNCDELNSVIIPNSITNIAGAFYGCSSLASVDIPNSVTNIDGAFYNCSGLTTVNIPKSVTTIKGAFQACENLTTVNFPQNVVSIDENAFNDCSSLTNLLLPDSLIIIGQTCFWGCNSLKSLTIPKNVLYIGSSVFSECESLETIKVDEANVKYDSRDNCNAIIETYTNTLILGCKSTTIPKNVIKIGEGSFAGCLELRSFNIPDNVLYIGSSAFWRCKGLTTLNIGNAVENIGYGAFDECEGLKTLIIPYSINNIEYRAFSNCKELKDIYCYASNVPQTDENAFGDYNYDISYIENATLHVPVASLEAYRQTAPWSGFGKIVALTDDDPKPTKVYSATTDDKYPQFSVYTINGRRISKPQRGLNILRMSNGTTKKVMACTRGQERCVN